VVWRESLSPENLSRRLGDVERTWPVAAACGASSQSLGEFRLSRRECAAAPATIELEIDGFYVVVHQEDGWPRPPLVVETKGPLVLDPSYRDAVSVARSRSFRFTEWRAWAMRLIAALVSGFVAVKRSNLVF